MTPLTGKELLNKLKEISHLSKSDKAKACGYVKGDRVQFSQFMTAILEAKGVALDSVEKTGGGRTASYRTRVQKNGNILVGKVYTQQMGLEPGDEFEIKVGHKHIHLVQITDEQAAA